ncbi:MAG: hypothetical protein IPQ24_21050 [Anaeromyxobacter sp.]|nr:hypothetical protein [Anaeromyxobacter sp.]
MTTTPPSTARKLRWKMIIPACTSEALRFQIRLKNAAAELTARSTRSPLNQSVEKITSPAAASRYTVTPTRQHPSTTTRMPMASFGEVSTP